MVLRSEYETGASALETLEEFLPHTTTPKVAGANVG